jgi:hypothetical protein
MLPHVDLGAEVQVRDHFLVTHIIASSVILLGLLYEGKTLAGDYVSLSFLFVFDVVSANTSFSDFFEKPSKRALQAVVNQARVSSISVQ